MTCEVRFAGPSVVGYTLNDGTENLLHHHVGGLDYTLLNVVSDCLDPIVKAGHSVCLADEFPKPWQLVAFHIKGEWMARLKIFIGFHDRGDQHLDLFGDDQPDRLAVFAAINPLEVYVVAERDLARLRPVSYILSPCFAFANPAAGLQSRDVSAGVSIEPKQWQAIQQALAA